MAHIIFQFFAGNSAAHRLRINLAVARIGIVIVAVANCLGATQKYSSLSTVLQEPPLAGDPITEKRSSSATRPYEGVA